jgi:hypothetical protein
MRRAGKAFHRRAGFAAFSAPAEATFAAILLVVWEYGCIPESRAGRTIERSVQSHNMLAISAVILLG